ncbi:hypothetical protein AMATHDRAFT_75195 [Amanita thiersii Skay4041]|uniref:Uncharacterized protein n=1 Tax=Amanita thiersii Skay4041 TaxID=703135 RepID=A0A2A9NNU3_9AGAR|nr:hypothetical protein AMATHDRAFT_75195 [Amanita thiersii Skay4041]
MYTGSSPLFNVPEIATLRRIKPLPKRRRTMPSVQVPVPSSLSAAAAAAATVATAEELLAHADTLSTRMALQSYYMPMLGSVHEFLAAAAASAGISAGEPSVSAVDFMYGVGAGIPPGIGSGFGGVGFSVGPMGISRDEEDEHGDGDYVDHLQQPGNTKKRKVPANVSLSSTGYLDGCEPSQDEGEERGIPMGRVESDDSSEPERYPYHSHQHHLLLQHARKSKLTAAMLAGLQHKEMLKARKRQLAAVLGALSHGDTLALDQALSVSYPFDDLKNSDPPKVRLSKRRVIRLGRLARIRTSEEDGKRGNRIPTCEFTFVCPSATADRLIATKEEVAMLRNRFEAELARQAAKAEQLAASSRGKKKKRSALANASNPHHLRNYVPSRSPHSGQYNANQSNNMQSWISPLPLKFLSAEIPQRGNHKGQARQSGISTALTNPGEEWICAFCEYDLFYGDEQRYRRAVRNRKKILRRRRRARERAAAAASGSRESGVRGTGDKATDGGNVDEVREGVGSGGGDGHGGDGGGGDGGGDGGGGDSGG